MKGKKLTSFGCCMSVHKACALEEEVLKTSSADTSTAEVLERISSVFFSL